jgi:hypothetical protein
MATYGHTFTSGDTLTPTKLNDARTATDIVNADISASAAIAATKLASDSITDTQIKSDAAIAGTKVAPNFGSQALSTTGSASVGSLIVSGNTTLGDAAADTITLTGTVQNGVVISGSSSGDALRITQTGLGNALVVEDSSNPDATPFVVTNIGDVGVNISAPANKLHVAKPSALVADTQLELEGGFGGYGAGVNFSSRTSSGGTLVAMAKITADGESSWNATASTQDAGLRFFTAADGSLAEHVRINSSGNVGIGLTAPTERLDVNGTAKATAFSGPLTGNVTGNASGSAATLATGRTIALTGDVTGTTGSFNGSANVSAATTIANNAVTPAKLSQPLTLATAQDTTSGTSIDFTGIPSWVKRITVLLNRVSTNGTSNYLVQLGSGTLTTSGYVSTATSGAAGVTTITETSGHIVAAGAAAASQFNGHLVLTLISGVTWVGSSLVLSTGSNGYSMGASDVSLSGALDRIRLTTVNGTDTFDAGSVNIMYEG